MKMKNFFFPPLLCAVFSSFPGRYPVLQQRVMIGQVKVGTKGFCGLMGDVKETCLVCTCCFSSPCTHYIVGHVSAFAPGRFKLKVSFNEHVSILIVPLYIDL